MSLVRLSTSYDAVISVNELHAHLRLGGLESDAEAAVVAGFSRMAQDAIESWLGRALTLAQWQLSLDSFPPTEIITLPKPPCRSVDSLTYIDADGVQQAITDFEVYGIGSATPARLAPAYGTRWPATRRQGDAIRIVFTAGDVQPPEAIRAAVLLTATDLYEHRGSIISGDGFERLQVTKAAESLLTPYRVW